MDLTREWLYFRKDLAFKKTMLMMEKYDEVVKPVDIPEFQKQLEDKLETKAVNYVNRLEYENRLDDFINS